MKKRNPADSGAGLPERSRQNSSSKLKRTKKGATGRKTERRVKRRRLSKKKKLQIAVVITLGTLLILLLGGYATWRSLIGKIEVVDPDDETIPSEYDYPTESLINPVPSDKSITNILLLGVDSREENNLESRSDSMMILTIDQKNDTIKLTSLQRDMLVYLPGKEEPEKLNAANVLGGPKLVVRVINDTLRLDIKNYAIVNMGGMEQLIDIAGGVMIDVQKAEIPYINTNIRGENRRSSKEEQAAYLENPGLQLLNGRQAVAYARVRKLDSDYVRMERQRTVLQALFDAFRDAELIRKSQMISEGLSYIKTNLSPGQITDLGLQVIPAMRSKIEQLQLPIRGYYKEDSRATWVNRCDFNGMIPLLQEFIWGRTFAYDPVKEIPGAPNSSIPLPTLPPTPTPKPTVETIPEPTPKPTSEPTPEPTPKPDPTTTTTTTETMPTLEPTPEQTTAPAETTTQESTTSETSTDETTTAVTTSETTTQEATTTGETAKNSGNLDGGENGAG